MPIKILAFAGALRKDSYNKKLIKIAVEGARAAGAEVTLIDLRDYALPIFDGDLEDAEGLPDNAKKLKKLFIEHHGLLLSCPEYNSSITGVLKNAIDWVSRSETDDEKPLLAFKGKVVGLVSASPGALGGIRGLMTVRSILTTIGSVVVPEQVCVGKADQAFNDDGTMKDAKQKAAVEKIGARVVDFAKKLNG